MSGDVMRRPIRLWKFTSVMRVYQRYSITHRIEFRPFRYFLCGLLSWFDGSVVDVFSILFLVLPGKFKNLLKMFPHLQGDMSSSYSRFIHKYFPINLSHLTLNEICSSYTVKCKSVVNPSSVSDDKYSVISSVQRLKEDSGSCVLKFHWTHFLHKFKVTFCQIARRMLG
jgi:hypothetical protein